MCVYVCVCVCARACVLRELFKSLEFMFGKDYDVRLFQTPPHRDLESGQRRTSRRWLIRKSEVKNQIEQKSQKFLWWIFICQIGTFSVWCWKRLQLESWSCQTCAWTGKITKSQKYSSPGIELGFCWRSEFLGFIFPLQMPAKQMRELRCAALR